MKTLPVYLCLVSFLAASALPSRSQEKECERCAKCPMCQENPGSGASSGGSQLIDPKKEVARIDLKLQLQQYQKISQMVDDARFELIMLGAGPEDRKEDRELLEKRLDILGIMRFEMRTVLEKATPVEK